MSNPLFFDEFRSSPEDDPDNDHPFGELKSELIMDSTEDDDSPFSIYTTAEILDPLEMPSVAPIPHRNPPPG